MMTGIHIPFAGLVTVGLPIMVAANFKSSFFPVRAVVKCLLSCFFLYAALQCVAIRAVQDDLDADVPAFWSMSSSLQFSYHGSESAGSDIAHALATSPAVFFVPSWKLIRLLADTRSHQQLLLIGLGLSWIGDVCLLAFGSTFWFTLGLFAFLFGHVFYTASFVSRYLDLGGVFLNPSGTFDVTFTGLALTFGVIAIIVYKWIERANLITKEPGLQTSVRAYLLVISVMMLSACTLAMLRNPMAADVTGVPNGLPLAQPAIQHVVNNAGPRIQNMVENAALGDHLSILRSAMASFTEGFGSTLVASHHEHKGAPRADPSLASDSKLAAGDTVASSSPPPSSSIQAMLCLGGATLFYFSDLFVGRERFVTSSHLNSILGLPLYYFGQILLAASLQY